MSALIEKSWERLVSSRIEAAGQGARACLAIVSGPALAGRCPVLDG